MKVIAILELSAGNETVGEMWKETKIFDENTHVKEIINWAKPEHSKNLRLKKNLILTEADEDL